MPEILKCKQEQVFYHVFSFSFLLYSVSKIKVKLALAIPTGGPMTVVKEIIDTPPLIAERTIKIVSV